MRLCMGLFGVLPENVDSRYHLQSKNVVQKAEFTPCPSGLAELFLHFMQQSILIPDYQ